MNSDTVAQISLVLAVIITLPTVGLLFGWSSIQAMLAHQNVYEFLCEANNGTTSLNSNSTISTDTSSEDLDCSQRDERFALAITIAVNALVLFRLPVAFVYHYLGPKIIGALGLIATGFGSLLFAYSTPRTADDFDGIIPAMICYAFCSVTTHLSCLSISHLFPEKKKEVVSLFSAVFTFSSLTLLVLSFIYFTAGVSQKMLFLVHSGIVFSFVPVLLWIIPSQDYRMGDEIYISRRGLIKLIPPDGEFDETPDDGDEDAQPLLSAMAPDGETPSDERHPQGETSQVSIEDLTHGLSSDNVRQNSNTSRTNLDNQNNSRSSNRTLVKGLTSTTRMRLSASYLAYKHHNNPYAHHFEPLEEVLWKNLHHCSLKDQLLSKEFLCSILLMLPLHIGLLYYVSVTPLELNKKGDNGMYANLLTLVLSFGGLEVLFGRKLVQIQNLRLRWCLLWFVAAFGYVLAHLISLIDHLPIQVLGFVIVSAARNQMLASYFAFYCQLFPSDSFPMLAGVSSLILGVLGSVTYLISYLRAQVFPENGDLVGHLITIGILGISIGCSLYLYFRSVAHYEKAQKTRTAV